MSKGDEEEIATAAFRFFALVAMRALLERPTFHPSFRIRTGKALGLA